MSPLSSVQPDTAQGTIEKLYRHIEALKEEAAQWRERALHTTGAPHGRDEERGVHDSSDGRIAFAGREGEVEALKRKVEEAESLAAEAWRELKAHKERVLELEWEVEENRRGSATAWREAEIAKMDAQSAKKECEEAKAEGKEVGVEALQALRQLKAENARLCAAAEGAVPVPEVTDDENVGHDSSSQEEEMWKMRTAMLNSQVEEMAIELEEAKREADDAWRLAAKARQGGWDAKQEVEKMKGAMRQRDSSSRSPSAVQGRPAASPSEDTATNDSDNDHSSPSQSNSNMEEVSVITVSVPDADRSSTTRNHQGSSAQTMIREQTNNSNRAVQRKSWQEREARMKAQMLRSLNAMHW